MLDWLEGPAVAATLRRVKELGAPVVGLRMRNADCSGEQLSRIILAQAEFEDVKFDGANLDNAVFTDAKMTYTTLKKSAKGGWCRVVGSARILLGCADLTDFLIGYGVSFGSIIISIYIVR